MNTTLAPEQSLTDLDPDADYLIRVEPPNDDPCYWEVASWSRGRDCFYRKHSNLTYYPEFVSSIYRIATSKEEVETR